MPTYSTPGVYIEEINTTPASVAPVATAVPAFIGYTEKAIGNQGEDLTNTAVRLTSLMEFEAMFGGPPLQNLTINVTKRVSSSGGLLGVEVTFEGTPPSAPAQLMHYSMQLYFANGGGPCYVYPVGSYADTVTVTHFQAAITALEATDEPTLLVFPDAVRLSEDNHATVISDALTSCNKTQDRFTIADVGNAIPNGTDDNGDVTTNFRSKLPNGVDFLKYGAAYFPYLSTSIPFHTSDAHITLTTFNTVTVDDSGGETSETSTGSGSKLSETTIKVDDTAVYNAIQSFITEAYVTMPPSGAVTGAYARVDRTRGVWKAPANVSLSRVIGPALRVTDDLQDGLNVDATSGKSVNAIRAFTGRGNLIWGARTLAGNDNEWRYVNVRRFANFVEESVEKAIGSFVFEPNDANTWVKVRTMIENFLINQWRDGALMGAKPEHAFNVAVGLNQTMSAQDILEGRMIVEVHLAIVRPAEFIVLRFMQKMPES